MDPDPVKPGAAHERLPISAKSLPDTPIKARFSAGDITTLFRPWETARGILLGVSGGPDSVALMLLAAEWVRGLAAPPPLYVATVDHGLRKESHGEAEMVARWAAALALVIERRFVSAAGWLAVAAIFSAFGVMHAYTLTSAGIEGRIGWGSAPAFAYSYAAGAVFLLLCAAYAKRSGQPTSTSAVRP